MKHSHRLFTLLIILSMLLGLFSMPAFTQGSAVLAQEETPPPTAEPTEPTVEPTVTPTEVPTATPTDEPTAVPTESTEVAPLILPEIR